MKILLDALPLTGLLTGISRYLRNLYKQIELLPEISVDYFDGKTCRTSMPEQADPTNWIRATDRIWKLPDPVIVGLRSTHWLLFERGLRKMISRHPPDIYHETAFTPAAIKNKVPQVFTLHDLSLMKCRAMHPRERVWFSDLFFKRRIACATQIITVSEFIRAEICAELKIPAEMVTTIHEAADPFFYPRSKIKVEEVKKSLGIPADYLLFVGTLEPRKNLKLVINAMQASDNDVPLVLTGWEGWGEKTWREMAKKAGIEKRIYTTGYVDEETLASLFSGAQAFVYPSLYEGFGLPVLEAMACNCPVICSNAASLPEVAGNAALLVNPHKPDELAEAIDRILASEALREDLIMKGRMRANQFSWQETARKTVEVFQKTLSRYRQ